MQTFPVKLPLGSQPQDTSRKLVRPDFVIAIELERQPGFIKGCFQDSELLWIKRSVAQSRTSPGPSPGLSPAPSALPRVPSPVPSPRMFPQEREELESKDYSNI